MPKTRDGIWFAVETIRPSDTLRPCERDEELSDVVVAT